MTDPRKRKLVGCGAEALADALLRLSVYSDDADNMVEQMIAMPLV